MSPEIDGEGDALRQQASTSQPVTKSKLPAGASRFQLELAFVCLVIVCGFGLRVAHLGELPLTLSDDEAINGADALRLFRSGQLIPFLQDNYGRETLFFYLQSLALQLYGISIFSLRFVSALTGTLTIPLMYAVGKRLKLNSLVFGRPLPLSMASMLAAIGLTVSYWHLYFSRVALRGILLPVLLLALVWCFWRGWYSQPGPPHTRMGGGRVWLVAAGFLLGLTFYTYFAARLLPLVFLTFFVMELMADRPNLKRRIIDFLIFFLTCALTIIPSVLYFYQNPQAFGSRIQTISILAGDAPLQTLGNNLMAIFQIYVLAGTWLGQWPALNVLSAAGFLVGLVVCLFQIKKAACRFLLLWWGIGVLALVFSQHDWARTSTVLRSVAAWPALFLVSAIGLTTLINLAYIGLTNLRRRTSAPRNTSLSPAGIVASLLLILVIGILMNIYHYFTVWATTYSSQRNDGAIQLTRYLNSQTDRLSLIPLSVFVNSETYFLLQSRYPALSNIDSKSLHSLLDSKQRAGAEQVSGVYLLPHEPAFETTFVLLVPSANGPGTAYLLPSLTIAKTKTLFTHTETASPLSTIVNRQQEPVAYVYPLTSDAPFLPEEPVAWQPIQANFNNDIWLTGYRTEPAVAKPGETITLYLEWQMRGLVDGDYDLFMHMFDVPQGQRRGQSNIPFSNIIHRWAGPLTFSDAHHFWVPLDGPEGVYLFETGLYHTFSQERLRVGSPTVRMVEAEAKEADQAPDDKVIVGKFHVQLQPPDPPEYPIHAQFGDSLVLIGGDLSETTPRPGQALRYTLHWQAIDSMAQDYTVFNHVLDTQGNIVAQQDSMPLGNRYPTSLWDPGEIVLDARSIPLPAELVPGVYTLRIGLYEPETGQRLPLKDSVKDYVDLPGVFSVETKR